MKKSREQLKAEFITEAEALFDELMEWEEQNEKPNLTQLEDIVLELRKQFGARLAQTVIKRQEERQPEHPHGEAPLPIVIALTTTATLTILLFIFPDVPLELARQMVMP